MQARLVLVAAVYSFVSGCTGAGADASGSSLGNPGQTSTTGASAGNTAGGTSSGGSSSIQSGGAGGFLASAGTTGDSGADRGGAAGSGGEVGRAGSSGSNAGIGGGGGAGPAGCAGVTNAKFCEDWDKLGPGKPSGDYSVSAGVVVDTSKAFSGNQSLHFLKMPKPANQTPSIRFSKQFPLASNDMHGRVMLFMAQTPKTSSHWNFITSSNSGGTEWSIGGQYGNFELVCDPPDNGLDSKTAFPGGKWVCLQWEFKYPGNDNTTFVTQVDGVAVDQGEFTGANSKGEKWQAGVWNDLKLGWEVFGSSDSDVEFWIDDLAFGEQVIACPTR